MKILLIVSFALLVSFVFLPIFGRAQSSSTACYSQEMLTDKMAAELGYDTPQAAAPNAAAVSQPAEANRLVLRKGIAETQSYDPDYGKQVSNTFSSAGPITKPVHPDDIPCTRESVRTVADIIAQNENY